MLLSISEYSARTFADAIPGVLARLPAGACLDVLVSEQVLPQVSQWIARSGPGAKACLIEAPGDIAFSVWTQDMFLAGSDGVLTLPPHFERYKDLEAAHMLAAGAGHETRKSNHYFEGGNMIACGDWLLIGADLGMQAKMDAEALARDLDPGRTPVVLGTEDPLAPEATSETVRPAPGWTETLNWKSLEGSRQPMFHIDLFVAPAGTAPNGKPRFLVGCPRRGAELLGHPLWPHARAEGFDEIARQLAEKGAEVIRNPLPLIWKDLPDKRHRTWFHLPENNVLVEDLGQDGRTVWLPCFASQTWPELSDVDNENAAIWAMLGYSVIRVPHMMSLAENLGGLHCMTKVIARDPVEASDEA